MRPIYTISAAIAFFAAVAVASSNSDFNPVSFAASEKVSSELSGEFTTFRWKGDSSIAQETFDVVVEDTARIQVTDYKNRGDSFEIFDNGKLVGATSEVSGEADEKAFAATPEEALEDDRFSKGVFTLGKGEHKITIKATGPYEAGTAAIRLLDHAEVAFHKQSGGKDDDDEEDWHHDDKDDKEEWHKADHDDGWNHDDDDDEDYEEEWEQEYEEKYWHDGDDMYPPFYDLDLSHTITVTKTVWVDAQIPVVAAPAPAPAPAPYEPAPNGRDHSGPHVEHDNKKNGRDHNRNHNLPHIH
ncbi:hypothetical protein BY458DRAFT_487309 [Sporodiniella umbellata]|nr:hypothetical protein BY458DRAFT_487309 [Sporodiniella umbellata]